MAKGFQELDKWAKGLKRLEKGVENGAAGVFDKNQTRYLQIAKRVATQYLLSNPSLDVEFEVWAERVQDFVGLIFSKAGGDYLEIFYRGRVESDKFTKPGSTVTYDDVLSWVRAGAENGGKDKTAVENSRNRADEQIAYDVFTAVRQNRLGFPGEKDYGPIAARLERWVDFGESSNVFLERLPGVLEAWEMALNPIMEADFSDWADQLIAKAFD
jgi:hypothetical protein